VLHLHREPVHRTWTYPRKQKGGRPRLSPEVESLIVRFRKEYPRWDYGKLLKLGYLVSVSSVRDVLKRLHTQPTAEPPAGGISWFIPRSISWLVISKQ